MPLVDDDGNLIDITRQWCLQSEDSQRRTLELLEIYREEIEDEDGKFSAQPLWTGRVLLEFTDRVPLVAYLSDEKDADALPVIDDLTFEIWEEWTNVAPLPQPVKPRPLGS